jgi:predicted transcriptional regulator
MKVKKIRIKSKDEFYGGLLTASEAMEDGQKPKPLRGEFFESLEAVRNVLTEKRLALWRMIRDQEPASILELSKIAKRDFKNVYQDVALLAAVGLVEIRKEKGKRGDTQRPVSLADSLQLEVA